LNALKLQPDFKAANHTLAELHLGLGELAEAKALAEKLVEQNAEDAGERLLLGNVYLRQKEPAKAREQFLAAREIVPGSTELAIKLAQTYADEKKFPQAEQELEGILTQQPHFLPALESLSNIWTAQHQLPKAVVRVEQYTKQAPNDPGAHLLLGKLYRQENKLDAARTEFARAIELDPKQSQASVQLGSIYQAEGKLDSAVQQFEKVLAQEPKNAFLQTLTADLYAKQKNWEMAGKHYEQALAIEPNFVPALNNLAFMYATRGTNLDVAISLAQKAKQLQPVSPVPTDTLAWVQYKKGLHALAVPLLEECVANDPGSSGYQYHLGAALFANGQKQKAKAHLEAALRLELGEEDAQDARRLLAALR